MAKKIEISKKEQARIIKEIRNGGLTGARKTLPEHLKFSLPTLKKFADQAGIVLPRGRRAPGRSIQTAQTREALVPVC